MAPNVSLRKLRLAQCQLLVVQPDIFLCQSQSGVPNRMTNALFVREASSSQEPTAVPWNCTLFEESERLAVISTFTLL